MACELEDIQVMVGVDILRRKEYSLLDSAGGHADSEDYRYRGNHCQLLELRVSQHGPENIQQIDGSRAIAEELTDGNHPTGFRISTSAKHRVQMGELTPCRPKLLLRDR